MNKRKNPEPVQKAEGKPAKKPKTDQASSSSSSSSSFSSCQRCQSRFIADSNAPVSSLSDDKNTWIIGTPKIGPVACLTTSDGGKILVEAENLAQSSKLLEGCLQRAAADKGDAKSARYPHPKNTLV